MRFEEEETASNEGDERRDTTLRMGSLKLGPTKFDVTKYDGRSDYLLWEKQVKGVLKASGLGKLLKDKPTDVRQSEWDDMQEQGVSIITLYLQPHLIKQIDEHDTCTSLFTALQQKYHHMELSNRLYTSLKLMSFKMKDNSTKIQDHIDAFNDLVVTLSNLGEELSDERKALHLLSSLTTSYQSLSRVLLHRDKSTITYNEVVSALLTDDIQQKMVSSSTPSSSSGNALTVNRGRTWNRNRGNVFGDRETISRAQGNVFGNRGNVSRNRGNDKTRSRSRSRSREKSLERKPVTCWKCNKVGHMKKDCRVTVNNPSSANVATTAMEVDLLDDEIL